jgi:hypothetical protein
MTTISFPLSRTSPLRLPTWGTPLAVRGNIRLPAGALGRIHARLGAALAPWASRIDVITLRFDDVNGPKGGVDVRCRAKVVLRGMRSVVVEMEATSAMAAFAAVVPPLVRAVVPAIGLRRSTTTRRVGARVRGVAGREAGVDPG